MADGTTDVGSELLEQVDALEVRARGGRPLGAAEPDVQRLPLRSHARRRRRRDPRVDREQAVLLPRVVRIEGDRRHAANSSQ